MHRISPRRCCPIDGTADAFLVVDALLFVTIAGAVRWILANYYDGDDEPGDSEVTRLSGSPEPPNRATRARSVA